MTTNAEKTYNAIIVDDESDNRIVLKALLKLFCPEINVLAESDNIKEAYTLIQKHNPELLFLDIKMPGGGGFELLEKFTKHTFEVIFVTSYDQYALNAIKASALDYLLKPVEESDLKKAIEKFKKVSGSARSSEEYSQQIQTLKTNLEDQKIAIHNRGNVVLLPVKSIIEVEADSNYSNVFSENADTINVPKTLGEWEELLAENPNFIRINKSSIINLTFCDHYEKGSPIVIVMKNGRKHPVSRRRRSEVLDKLKQ
jgi:two-component system LytT family response regulator